MRLFQIKRPLIDTKCLKNKFETPLGNIFLDIEVDKSKLSNMDYSICKHYNNDVYITGWYTDRLEAELLMCKPKINLPPDLIVEDCNVGIWRLKTKGNNQSCSFIAKWEDGYKWVDGGIDSGEGLEAQTWDNENFEITLGTQDEETLISREYNKYMIPLKFDTTINKEIAVIHKLNGIVIQNFGLLPNKIHQIHFAVAWAKKEPDNVSTWYAVDLEPTEILKELIE